MLEKSDQQSGAGSTEGDRGGSQPRYSPGDDRAMIKNPTHSSYEADQENREEQKKLGS